MSKPTFVFATVVAFAAVTFADAHDAAAGTYPTNLCVAKKQRAAGKFCAELGKAWSKFHGKGAVDAAARDESIAKAGVKLADRWTKAEAGAQKKGVDCAVTTVDAATMQTALASDFATLQTQVTVSLNTGASNKDARCASKILRAAGKACSGRLSSESVFIKAMTKDPGKVKLNAGKAKADAGFVKNYDKFAPSCDGTPATSVFISDTIEVIGDDAVFNTITSPGLEEVTTAITFEAGVDSVEYQGDTLFPQCVFGTDYTYFYKRGTVNKLLMYYQGGGACWSGASCSVPTCKAESGPGDNPDLVGTGYADLNDPRNTFKDWHVVFVSYCTCDVHWGNNEQFYGSGFTGKHIGRSNARVAEKFAREHFPNPEQVFVTGSSAGAYGAIFNSVFLMHDIYPASDFDVLGDAGAGVITQEWLDASFPVWGVQNELPVFIPELDVPANTLSLPNMYEHIANFFPQHQFGMYQSAYDGSGGGQAAFYHVMKNPNAPLTWGNWWEDTCEWNACMREFTSYVETAVPNFRSYTGAGSRHTVYGADKLYEDMTGGVIPLVDWIDQMVTNDPTWASETCGDGAGEEGVGPGCDLINTCQGGTNKGLPCTDDVDCPGGACEFDPDSPQPPYNGNGTVTCPATSCPCASGPFTTGVACPN